MEKVELSWGSNLDDAILLLQEQKEAGSSVYLDFNGVRLYSDNITIADAYRSVYNMSREEYNLKKLDIIHNQNNLRQYALEDLIDAIEEKVEEGSSLIYPENMFDWRILVSKVYNKKGYHGREINDALKIMEMLEMCDDVNLAVDVLNSQGHSEKSIGRVRRIVFNFSKRGPEFILAALTNFTQEDKDRIQNKKIENDILEEKYSENVMSR